MTYIYWLIIAGLVWNCVYFSRAYHKQVAIISELRFQVKLLGDDRDRVYDDYQTLKAKIIKRATPEVVSSVPRRYTGPQLRVLNDRLNAQATESLQERPNSEVLKEASNG